MANSTASLWKSFRTNYGIFLLISLFYFLIHLTNLTLLPIFNDEAIYLDWGWTNTHTPGLLYDSLRDAKQPLIIWIFGIAQNIFSDPLFAGRFVSVVIGYITLLGIYQLTKQLINKPAAFIAAALFSIIPIFVFYNRQALMEAAIACIGIWSCYLLLTILNKPSTKNSILLGAVLGTGFLIKSSSLAFIISTVVLLLFIIVVKKRIMVVTTFFTALLTFFTVSFILFINPLFWETFSSNSRYAFTLSELFTFPLAIWLTNISGFFEIGFVFVTPLIFLTSFVGLYLFYKNRSDKHIAFILFFLLALLVEIFTGKIQSQRYIVSFLPFLCIPAAYVLYLLWSGALWKKALAALSVSVPLYLTLLLITSPEAYIVQQQAFSGYSEMTYIRGQTSGYGINDAMHYIQDHSAGQPTMVLFGFATGNPENAINLYAQKQPQLYAMRTDSQLFTDRDTIACLTSQYPVFFVTRADQRLGLEKYFTLEKSFANPDKQYSVNIYTLHKNCNGKSGSLSKFYQPTMDKISQMRKGNF